MVDAKRAKQAGRRVFRDDIRERLIEDILSGRLPPGTRLVEAKLAQQLGVSQGPVREALRDLELFGLVVSSPFRGTAVRKVSTEDLFEIYPIRRALESVASRAAAERINGRTLARLEKLIGVMRDAALREDPRAHVNADLAFHRTIVKASGNRMLGHIWETLRLPMAMFVTHSVTHRSLSEIGERHVELLEALRSGDPLVAEAAMRRHIEEPGGRLLASLQHEREPLRTERKEYEAAG